MYVLAVLGACGFSPTVVYNTDAGQGSASDAGLVATRCHVADPDLRMCMDFEEHPLGTTIADLAMGHDGSAENVAAVLRESWQAGAFAHDPITDIGSEIEIPPSPDLELPDHVTFELYLGMVAPPEAGVWPFDNYGEYGLKFSNDLITCYAGGAYASAMAPLTLGWHHIACAYGDGKLRAYVDGENIRCHTTQGTIHQVGEGIKLGVGFTGGIDDVHIYARTLGSNEIATHAGATPRADAVCQTN